MWLSFLLCVFSYRAGYHHPNIFQNVLVNYVSHQQKRYTPALYYFAVTATHCFRFVNVCFGVIGNERARFHFILDGGIGIKKFGTTHTHTHRNRVGTEKSGSGSKHYGAMRRKLQTCQ